MFNGLKDKLRTVKKNVGLFGTEDDTVKSKVRPEFNPNAGASLLQHFEAQWEEIHKSNEENALAADKAAAEIQTISGKITATKTNIDLIAHLMTNTNFTSNITQCLTQVKELYSVCDQVERKLVDLENLLEDIEFDRMVRQHRHHLENYKVRQQESLEKLQCSLEEQYQKKLAEHESSKKLILEERQKVFQEAFKTDLEVYKSLGTIPKVDLPSKQNGAILEEIQLDFDQSELEQFFNEESEGNPIS